MGERLVVEIFEKHDQDPLCAIYYHWSGYTAAMFEELTRLIHLIRMESFVYENVRIEPCIDSASFADVPEDDLLLRLIRGIEMMGGMVSPKTPNLKMLHGLYPNRTFKDDRSRNEGLIDVSKDEIEETRKWGEHSAQVYLDTRTVQVSYNTISCDEWVAAYADEGKTEDDFERLPVSPYDYLDEISFEAVIDTNQHPEYSEHFMKVPEEPDWAFDPCC